MHITTLSTAGFIKGRIVPVKVEVDIHPGLPVFSIIGLPDRQIAEAKERIRAAIRNSGFAFPRGRITVNLSPSAFPKEGTSFDLAIAAGLLLHTAQIPNPGECWLIGELALDGSVQPVQHLELYLLAAAAKNISCIIPAAQALQARLVKVSILQMPSLRILQRNLPFRFSVLLKQPTQPTRLEYLFDKVSDQPVARRVIALALAGKHTLLMSGPPGVGKTFLAEAAAELMPSLTKSELIELVQLKAKAGMAQSLRDWQRPFNHPHSKISLRSLIGGGQSLAPGELSLSYGGILFLDEFAEMKTEVREGLRQPLQEGEVRLASGSGTAAYPTTHMVWGAYNSCPCGLLGVEGETCRCTVGQLMKYQRALSEPLLERFALHVFLQKSKQNKPDSLTGAHVAQRVEALWNTKQIPLEWDDKAATQYEQTCKSLKLSQRVRKTIREVAETIARFDVKSFVDKASVHEALQYRFRRT